MSISQITTVFQTGRTVIETAKVIEIDTSPERLTLLKNLYTTMSEQDFALLDDFIKDSLSEKEAKIFSASAQLNKDAVAMTNAQKKTISINAELDEIIERAYTVLELHDLETEFKNTLNEEEELTLSEILSIAELNAQNININAYPIMD